MTHIICGGGERRFSLLVISILALWGRKKGDRAQVTDLDINKTSRQDKMTSELSTNICGFYDRLHTMTYGCVCLYSPADGSRSSQVASSTHYWRHWRFAVGLLIGLSSVSQSVPHSPPVVPKKPRGGPWINEKMWSRSDCCAVVSVQKGQVTASHCFSLGRSLRNTLEKSYFVVVMVL